MGLTLVSDLWHRLALSEQPNTALNQSLLLLFIPYVCIDQTDAGCTSNQLLQQFQHTYASS